MTNEKEGDTETLRRFIEIVDEALAAGEWQGTHLLRSMEKKIKGLREEAEQLQLQLKEESMAKSIGAGGSSSSNLETVYVSVYQQDFNDLRRWERTLKSITDYSVTRPVYKEEEHIKEMIRGRPDPNKEGYVAVMVKKEDIVKGFAGKPATDKSGYELLNIKEGGVRPGGIRRFVLGDRTYEFVDGSLVMMASQPAAK